MTRSGADYIQGLRDGRAVFLNGSRVDDVTTHPAFRGAIRSIADLYDLANDPANRDLLTYPSPRDGRPVNTSWLTPRTREDLAARRVAIKRLHDTSYGLLGRSPDHVASFFAAFGGSGEFFARGRQEFADNLLRFYARAADDDLYLSYTIVHPTIDRAKPAHQQPEPFLYAGAIAERDGGIVIRGAQMLGTGSVMSDWIFVTVILPLRPGDEDYAISVVVPCSARGLKIYTRRPYALGAPSVFDYPLSTRFDETDSLVVFDDVFVPWEHVFIYKDLALTFGQFNDTAAHVLGNTQAHIRFWAKLQFLAGLVKRVMDGSGQSARPDVQALLGEIATQVSLVEGLILAAEAKAAPDQYSVMRPDGGMVYANQVLQAALYPELLIKVRGMLGGSVIQLPSSVGELLNPETAADINRYTRWPDVPGEQRVKLLKLVWDLVGSEFGSRHLQYEMFYAGEPAAVKGREFRSFDWADAERLVDQCLDSYDVSTAGAPPPSPPQAATQTSGSPSGG
jgi:4-hydroxyphenylacetate 3-monooxygenase